MAPQVGSDLSAGQHRYLINMAHLVAVFEEEGGWVYDCFCGATAARRAPSRREAWLDAFRQHQEGDGLFEDRMSEAGWIPRSVSRFDGEVLVVAQPTSPEIFLKDKHLSTDKTTVSRLRTIFKNEEKWWESDDV